MIFIELTKEEHAKAYNDRKYAAKLALERTGGTGEPQRFQGLYSVKVKDVLHKVLVNKNGIMLRPVGTAYNKTAVRIAEVLMEDVSGKDDHELLEFAVSNRNDEFIGWCETWGKKIDHIRHLGVFRRSDNTYYRIAVIDGKLCELVMNDFRGKLKCVREHLDFYYKVNYPNENMNLHQLEQAFWVNKNLGLVLPYKEIARRVI